MIDDMKTHLEHEYGMTIRTADDGEQTITCRARRTETALANLHDKAQARWPADAYVMTAFWEEYPIDQRQPPTMKRSDFDLPKGPNPVHERRKKAVEQTLPMFSEAEMKRCGAK